MSAAKRRVAYARWFDESRAFDDVGRTPEQKREIADDLESIARHFEQRASDSFRLSVCWPTFENCDPPVGGPRIADCWEWVGEEKAEEARNDPDRRDFAVNYQQRYDEAFWNLKVDAPRYLKSLEDAGIRLPDGHQATSEGRLLLWSIYVSENDAPTSHMRNWEASRDGSFKVIAEALRVLQRTLRSDARKQDAGEDEDPPPIAGSPGANGVSLLDAALVLQGATSPKKISSQLRERANEMKDRWSKDREMKESRPADIGRDPNKKQRRLYDVKGLADWIELYERTAMAKVGGKKGFKDKLKNFLKEVDASEFIVETTDRTTTRTARILQKS